MLSFEPFGGCHLVAGTTWLGPETHWRNAEDRIRQEFAEYNVLVEIGADCRCLGGRCGLVVVVEFML